jgi:hypothetical protein
MTSYSCSYRAAVSRRGRAANLQKNHQLDASSDRSSMERCLEMRRRAPGTDQVYATLVIRKVGLGARYRAHGLRQRRALWRPA